MVKAIVSGSCGHLSGQAENGESPCSAEWPRIATGQVRQPPPPPPELDLDISKQTARLILVPRSDNSLLMIT